ncbi:MAG: lysophospholipase [Treponema sp.]|nr:lysophospholipase [Treponema sp.]
MSDGQEIFVRRWIPSGNIKGIVQLVHGMVEHTARYEQFAQFLSANGWVFSAHDQRGHGKTAERDVENKTGDFGFLAKKSGFEHVVNDVREIIQKAKADYSGKPIILFGHSFGSFVSQSFIEEYPLDVSACILCGTAGPRKAMIAGGRMLVGLISFFRGMYHRSSFVQKMVFGSYSKLIPDSVTGQEWLSRDSNVVKAYLDDPLCGFNPTLGFYGDMLYGLQKIHKGTNIKKIDKSLPVLFIYGTADPVGSYGKTILSLYKIYCKNGMNYVTLKEYDGARHELLNEINKAEVEQDILSYIDSVYQSNQSGLS